MLAKYTRKCTECNDYIITGRHYIRKLRDVTTTWVHENCYVRYWDRIQNQMTLEDEADNRNDDIWLEKKGL